MESEKKPVVQEKPVIEKKETQPTPKSPKSQSALLKWIIVAVVFIIFLVGAIALGFLAERRFGSSVFQVLPKNITSKWINNGLPVAEEKKTEPEANYNNETVSPTFNKPSQIVSPSVSEEPPPDGDTGFILSFSSTRKVVNDDLTGLTPWELKVARNEIYARHGRPFVHKDLSCYFAKQLWYTTDLAYSDKSLSALEVANAVFILNFEKGINNPLVDKDSGCK